jgi:Spy/CpxP family protein refolding chaperone
MLTDRHSILASRTWLRRGTLLMGALAVAGTLALSAPAHAQFGGRSSLADAFQPDVLQRDMPLMIDTLGLEEWQRPVMEALLEDYRTSFEGGMLEAKERMKNAGQDAAKGGNGDAMVARILEQMETWRGQKQVLVEKFYADVKSQLGPQQLERWPKFERALRRERQLPEGELSGERLNLWTELAQMQLTPAEQEAVRPALDTYEVALDAALVNRIAKLRELAPELTDAMKAMDYERGAGVQDRIMAARIQVRAATDEGIDAIAKAIGARGEQFRRAALAAGYPDAYREHPVMMLIDTARKLDSITPEQAAQIDALKAEFQGVCDTENAKFYELLRVEEPKAPRRKVQAMIERRNNGGQPRSAPSTPQGANNADPVIKMRVERDKLGEPYRERLMAILTPEQQESIPGAAKLDPTRVRPKDPNAKDNADPSKALGSANPEDPAEAQRKADKKAAREARGKRDGRALTGAPPRSQPGTASPPLPNETK